MDYFEVFYLDDEEFFTVCNNQPFPLISIGETVTIDGRYYIVYKREQIRSKTETEINYYVTTS